MAGKSPTIIFTPLSKLASEIRLIRLEPRTIAEPDLIACSFHTANLDNLDCIYEALSYEWGYESDTQYSIILDRREFPVRENLWRALWHLRDDGKPGRLRELWVDALCIDQSNDAERNHQVCLS